MDFGISNDDDALHGMHEENDLNSLREQVRSQRNHIVTQDKKIAALEIKARKLTKLKKEVKELRAHAAQLEVYQKLTEKCHKTRHS